MDKTKSNANGIMTQLKVWLMAQVDSKINKGGF